MLIECDSEYFCRPTQKFILPWFPLLTIMLLTSCYIETTMDAAWRVTSMMPLKVACGM